MLSDAERGAIDAAVAVAPRPPAAVIDALVAVQRHRRWVDDEAVADVAEALGMSVHEVDSVATFYNLIFRRPVGRHVVLHCASVSCWLTGGERNRRALEERLGVGLGETTGDGRFTLLPIQCLGACDRAPVMMIDEETHFGVDRDGLDAILEGYE